MSKVLVSNNSELLRNLSASPFRKLPLELSVVSSGEEALRVFQDEEVDLAILDAEMATVSGYEVALRIKASAPQCRVILVMDKRINAERMRRVADSGCDEVVIAPMAADELYDIVATQLGLPRRGSERYRIDVAVVTDGGVKKIDGRVTNLSVDGARLVVPDSVSEETPLQVTISPEVGEPIVLAARVVWSQPWGEHCIIGASFDGVPEPLASRLFRLVQWEIIEDTERTRVVIKGDLTEATSFRELLPAMVGRVDFDLSQVRYMSSLGVRAWVDFLHEAPIQGYEFHACSVPFILQASLAAAVLGRGTVTSFFAPYICQRCEHEDTRLLQSATILASEDRQAPTFACPKCGGDFVLDDLPQRYFAFLMDDQRTFSAD